MKQVILRTANGQYLIEGRGFVGSKNEATRFSPEQVDCKVKCAATFGLTASPEEVQNISFAVVYIRENDTVTIDGGRVAVNFVAPNGAAGQRNPSRRRFATHKEACIHGSRFYLRRKNRGDEPGSANHKGVVVIETNDPVNAAVNPATGLTNPVNG